MTNNELIDIYEKVSNSVKSRIKDIYTGYRVLHLELDEEFEFVLRERIEKKKLLRPFINKLAFFVLSKLDNEIKISDNVKENVMTCCELFNISTYQTNYVFDNKNTQYFRNLNNQIIFSYLNISIISRIINKLKIDSETKSALNNHILKCNEKVYLGQYLDLNTLSFQNIDTIKSWSRKYFTDKYFERCIYLGGYTIYFSMISPLLFGKNIELSLFYDLGEAALQYGGLMQLLNDINDFLSSEMNDLDTQKVTLPIYGGLQQISNNFKTTFDYSNLTLIDFETKLNIIRNMEVKQFIDEKFKSILAIFEKRSYLELDNYFSIFYETIYRSDFYQIAFNNK